MVNAISPEEFDLENPYFCIFLILFSLNQDIFAFALIITKVFLLLSFDALRLPYFVTLTSLSALLSE